MNVPDELRYSRDHEWVRVEGDTVVVGITDFAQHNLGDVVFVQLPEVGTTVSAADSISEIESTKSVSDIYAPVSGAVTAVNDALQEQPELVNQDPYGAGWIFRVELVEAAKAEVEALLDASAYRALTED